MDTQAAFKDLAVAYLYLQRVSAYFITKKANCCFKVEDQILTSLLPF